MFENFYEQKTTLSDDVLGVMKEGFDKLHPETWFIISPVVVYWLAGLMFHIILDSPSLERYRIRSDIEDNRNKVSVWQAIPWVALQHSIQMGLGWVLSIVDPQSLEMDPLPVCVFKFFIGMIVMDTWQH